MPTYDFKCSECYGVISIQASVTDNPKPLCSNCGGPMSRVFAPPAVTFNGSGFYSTDKKK
jgi:putative FmdB family regulatory protein